MLSYKHGYHAGNHADVFKHIVLIYLYNIEKKTLKSISYIDTHSGSSIYKYTSKYMDKNKEYKFGIKKIQKYVGKNNLINNYLKILKKISIKNNFYPGSPYIISFISNKLDKLFFCELHKNEHKNLKLNLKKFTNTKIINEDGFDYINKFSSGDKKQFILIDPSYEIKDDFKKIYTLIDNINFKFLKSKIIIWYPILNFTENDEFIDTLRKMGLNNLLNLELPIYNDDNEKGMKGSGLLIINFKNKLLFKNLKSLIKDLSKCLKDNDRVYKPKIRYL